MLISVLNNLSIVPQTQFKKLISLTSEFDSTKNCNFIINLHLNKGVKLGFCINLWAICKNHNVLNISA